MFQKYPKKREKHFITFCRYVDDVFCPLLLVSTVESVILSLFSDGHLSPCHILTHSLSLSLSLSHTHTLSPTPIHTCTLSQREADILCLSMVRSENTYLLRKGSITSCLTGLDLTRQVKLFFIQHEQSAESKQNKQEVSHTVILTLKLVLSGYRGSLCPVCRINLPPIAQIPFARSSLCLGLSCSHKKEIKAV